MKTYGQAVKEVLKLIGKERKRYFDSKTMTKNERDKNIFKAIENWIIKHYQEYEKETYEKD